VVGDKVLDVQTGRAFGCRTAWVGPKAWRKRFAKEMTEWHPDVVADDLRRAAKAIVALGPAEGLRGPTTKY